MQLYAPIAWKKCYRRSSATSWAISYPVTLYSQYQRRQPTIKSLCDRILQSLDDLSSLDIFSTSMKNIQEKIEQKLLILCSIPPITNYDMFTISSDQNPYELSPQQSTLPSSLPNPNDFSSIFGEYSILSLPSLSRTQNLLHGLFIYDSVQLQLPSICSTRSANPHATCEDATELSVVLPPILADLSTKKLFKLLMAVHAIHLTLQINLAKVLSEDDVDSNPENPTPTSTVIIYDDVVEKEEENLNHDDANTNNINMVSPTDDVAVKTTSVLLGDNNVETPSPEYTTENPAKYSNSSTYLSTPSAPPHHSYITTTDFKIDGWLRLGCSSLLSIFNMCSNATEMLNDLANAHHAAQERDMIRECLSYFVDSGSSSSPGIVSCTNDNVLQNNHIGNITVDHRSTWEILIKSTIAQKTGQQN